LVKIDGVTLDDVQDIMYLKTRVLSETAVLEQNVASRESLAGYGREWNVTGVMSDLSLSALVAKIETYQGFANGRTHILDREDGSDIVPVLILDPEVHEVAGYPLSRDYTLRCLEKPPFFKRFRQTPPTIVQSLAFWMLPPTLTQDPPTISMSLESLLAKLVQIQQDPPTITQSLTSISFSKQGFTTTGSTTYPEVNFGGSSGGGSDSSGGNLQGGRFQSLNYPITIRNIEQYSKSAGNMHARVYTDGAGPLPTTALSDDREKTGCIQNAWNRAPNFSTRVYLSTATYVWLAGVGSATGVLGYTSGGGTTKWKNLGGYQACPDPFSSSPNSDGNTQNFRAVSIRTKGYIKGTKFTVAGSGSKSVYSVLFYAHASGNVRLGIYDNAATKALVWESGSTAVTAGWNEILISAGTPTTLSLTGGPDYWHCWQTDSVNDVPSYTTGSAGDGFYYAQAYGAFPATLASVTSSAEKWTMYAMIET